MKRASLFIVIAGSTVTPLIARLCPNSCDTQAISHTFLNIQPHFKSMLPEMVSGFRSERVHARSDVEDSKHAAAQFVLFGSKTTNGDEMAAHFAPFGQASLLVGEEVKAFPGDTRPDVLAQHFNIHTHNGDFFSRINFEAKQSAIGLGMHYRKSFYRDEEKERGFWFSVSAPITRVRNEFIMTETVINDGGGKNETVDTAVVSNMTEAFRQSEWLFGKIDPDISSDKTQLADIELKLGYEWLQHDPCHLETYVGLVIPTSNKPKGEVIFEPISGYGRHFGIMFGSEFGVQIHRDEEKDRTVRVEHSTYSHYLFSNEQTRALDLKDKPWSRYMEVYRDQSQAQEAANLINVDPFRAATLATPGINVFTHPVKVLPGFAHNMTTAVVAYKGCGHAEIGYNFLVRQEECVSLACPWKEGVALKHRNGEGLTTTTRDITGDRVLESDTQILDQVTNAIVYPIQLADYDRAVIKEEDLSLHSAATPCQFMQTIYGSLGARWDDRDYPTFFDVGGSYSFSGTIKSVPKRWTLWAKAGMSF